MFVRGTCTNKMKQRRIIINLCELQGISVTVTFMSSFRRKFMSSQVRKVFSFTFEYVTVIYCPLGKSRALMSVTPKQNKLIVTVERKTSDRIKT